MMMHLILRHADWLRLLAVLGNGEFDWLSTGYYIPLTAIGLFRFGIYASNVPTGGSHRRKGVNSLRISHFNVFSQNDG